MSVSSSPRPLRPTGGSPSKASSSSTKGGSDALASLRIERDRPRGRSSRKWPWFLFVLLLVGGGALGFWYANQQGWIGNGDEVAGWMPAIMQKRTEVRLTRVSVEQGRSADAVVVATGYLESRRQARIGARAVGRMEKIYFDEGDRVEEGQVLAELEHRDLDALLDAAKASVDRAIALLNEQEIAIAQAEADFQRAEELWQTRSISEAEYDTARFAFQSAKARKQSMEADVKLSTAQMVQNEELKENMFIRAPFSGTIISKDAEVGESITPGGLGAGSGRGSVATIADLDRLEIEVDVQEDFISRVSENQEAEIAVDAVQDKRYHGRVRKIIPMGDRARATIKVQVAIEDADALLFPEMAGTVYFLPGENPDSSLDDAPRVFCKSTAVDELDDGSKAVWTVGKDDLAVSIPVTVGESRDGRTEILSGLDGGERIVVNPQELYEGAPVTVSQ